MRQLLRACQDNNVHYVKELLDSIRVEDINYADPDAGNKTALHLATEADHREIVELLLERRLIDLDCRDSVGNTPLHLAAYRGRYILVDRLLNQPGIRPNLQNKQGDTALIYVSSQVLGDAASVRFLIDREEVDPDIQNNHLETALVCAIKQGYCTGAA